MQSYKKAFYCVKHDSGAAIFGVGWGLGGFCPEPALANLGAFRIPALIFVSAMAIGMLLAQRFLRADR